MKEQAASINLYNNERPFDELRDLQKPRIVEPVETPDQNRINN